jgi:hypothetical protein
MLQTIYFIIFIKHLVTVITCIDSWVCVCSGSDDSETLQAQKNWKKSIMLVWRAAANHKLVQFISLEDTVSPLIEDTVSPAIRAYRCDISFLDTFFPPSLPPPSLPPPVSILASRNQTSGFCPPNIELGERIGRYAFHIMWNYSTCPIVFVKEIG